MAAHPDLQAEQAYIDRAYVRLDAMRRAAEDLRDSVIGSGKGGTHQARVERDVFVRTSLQRLEQLQLGRSSLCFGRIDRADGPQADGADERFYVGRLAVSDEHQEPMIVDWRAPVAEAFYRATGRAPMGLRRRRHFATDGRTLLAIEDEVFSADGDTGDDLDLVGPGALLAALQRSRSGQMRDIVATVQREQDEIIRSELPGLLVVQGGPGTGKTAVALHRAAYLLYTHRFPLETQGVLVVGPNQLFLRYIEQVLPSLGESGVVLTTIGGLMARIRPRHRDTPFAERVKGDARMAEVLARAVSDRQRPLRDDLAVGYGATTLRIAARVTAGIVQAVKRRGGTHNGRRRMVESMLMRALHEQFVVAVEKGHVAIEDDDFVADARRHPAVVTALDRMWPILTPEDLVNDLFGAAPFLQLATRELLTPAERDALARDRAHTLEDVAWTPADIPLLDEARALLGPPRSRRGDGDFRTYGHIVVDEAQDVSPMALRMLGRRSMAGSMTLVGDIGQATTALAPASWEQILSQLPQPRPSRLSYLTVNYRTPAEIMNVAASVLEAAKVPGASTPRSVRATGRAPMVRSVSAAERADEVAAVAGRELGAVDGGTVAVIAPALLLEVVGAALEAAGLAWGAPERTGLSAPITVLDVPAAKGLEFDSVVVVEPAGIVQEPGQGLRALYVALTRTTRRLVIVHAEPLPASLAQGLAGAVVEGPIAQLRG
ncbi:MAG: HelD family protein [Acidimicrobiales bacterium]